MPRSPAPVCSQAPLGASCCCCKRCKVGGCDLRVLECGCCFHARCCPVSQDKLLTACPICGIQVKTLRIMPMVFDEIDQAQREASSTALTEKRGKKRKNATIARLSSPSLVAAATTSLSCSAVNPTEDAESANGLRSGRWTDEETDYCDKLIELFEQGQLPIPDGIKLNDFLSNMFKSKQSRLTKKMKNARLSARLYKHEAGYIVTDDVATDVSKSETEFFASIKCTMERSEIRFHMQREWRELFINYCTSAGQSVDAYDWMKSVEELDRRVSMQLDAARMARRKIMMGLALEKDTQSTSSGVFIDTETASTPILPLDGTNNYRSASPTSTVASLKPSGNNGIGPVSSTKKFDKVRYYSSQLIKKVLQFVQRYALPFEYCDIWVPSFTVGGVGADLNSGDGVAQKCRLFFAGFGVAEYLVPENNDGPADPMSSEEFFDYLSFGEYSEKFSFDVGCGLPGRVYTSGVPSWEQGIQNAPREKFERQGGAEQWGIQTALGIPIPSPNVERIVAVFYSKFDRSQNLDLVDRLCTELSKLMPTPRWNLVVDVGAVSLPSVTENKEDCQKQLELLRLLEAYMPKNKNSPLALFLPGFTSLRLLLVKQEKTDKDFELIRSILVSYSSYLQAGRSESDIIAMTARDFMLLTKHGRQEIVTDDSSSSSRRETVLIENTQQQQHLIQEQYQVQQYSNNNQIQQQQITSMPSQIPGNGNNALLRPLSIPTIGHDSHYHSSDIVDANLQCLFSMNGDASSQYDKNQIESAPTFPGSNHASSTQQETLGNISPLLFGLPVQNDHLSFRISDSAEGFF